MSRAAGAIAHHSGALQSWFHSWARRSLARVSGWFVVPRPALAARLTLVALALVLQNLLELPRTVFSGVIGVTLTGVLVVALLAASLVLLLAAVGQRPPRWRWPYRRGVQILALCLTLAVVPLGVAQCVKIGAASLSPPQYSNDGTMLDHFAAQQLIKGHNPYAASNIVDAVRFLHQDAAFTTPLRQGEFANRAPGDYPTEAERRAVFARNADHPGGPVEFESRVSYPALAFLPLVPFVWAGLPSVVVFFALCLLALAVVLIRGAPRDARLWLALLLLADTPLLNATLVGDLDVFYILLLFVAWRWFRRPLVATVAFGLALAAKQLAWFFAPFYLLYVWRRAGLRAAGVRLAGGAALFAVINAPFIVANPAAWLRGVLAPQLDPMFPLGSGLVRLSLAGVLPLPSSGVYLTLEALAIVACLFVYWRERSPAAGTGFVLPVLPLWFAWRSLTTYFYFVALPALALALADGAENASVGAERGERDAGDAGDDAQDVRRATASGVTRDE